MISVFIVSVGPDLSHKCRKAYAAKAFAKFGLVVEAASINKWWDKNMFFGSEGLDHESWLELVWARIVIDLTTC